jgi:hypothetical protein
MHLGLDNVVVIFALAQVLTSDHLSPMPISLAEMGMPLSIAQ